MRAFVVWEPVLFTDWTAPSTAALRRVSDRRAVQFWDKGRLISRLLMSKQMAAPGRRGVIWDYVAVYAPGAVWKVAPPEALYHGGPVVRAAEQAGAAIAQALQQAQGTAEVADRGE